MVIVAVITLEADVHLIKDEADDVGVDVLEDLTGAGDGGAHGPAALDHEYDSIHQRREQDAVGNRKLSYVRR